MSKFLEAFAYFLSNGLDFKLAKELAESVTGSKVTDEKTLEAFVPEIKKSAGKSQKFQMPEAKKDVIAASDEVSPSYAKGDTKYNADILAEEIARKRGFIKEGQDADDMDVKAYSEIYSEAYKFLTDLNRLNKPGVKVETPKKLATKKVRGDLTFVDTKISNPLKSDFVLRGLDGTTENLYNKFRQEQEAIKNGMLKDLNFIKDNNIALGAKDKDNLLYNMKIYNELTNKVNKTADELVEAGKEPEKIYTSYRDSIFTKKKVTMTDLKEFFIGKDGTIDSMKESLDKMDDLIKEIEDIRSGAKQSREFKERKLKFQGKGYGDDSPLYRTLARQFLRDEIEAGRIETSQRIYNAMKTGSDPQIDAIKIFRHHYGDDAFDILGKYIDVNYPQFDANLPGLRYPGRFEFRKMGLVPKNKKAPGNTYEHYSLPGEIDQEIKEIDDVIKNIEAGNSPFYKNRDEIVRGIMEQNSRRANLVKVRNEISPEDTKPLPGDETLESADVVPIKQEGIISNLDLNIDRSIKTLNDVELYGDETSLELKYIEENGVHPRDLDPQEGFAKGGLVSLT
jgi:hypothetical protein